MRKKLFAMLMSMTVLSLTAMPVYAQEKTDAVPAAVEVENPEETEQQLGDLPVLDSEEGEDVLIQTKEMQETLGDTVVATGEEVKNGWVYDEYYTYYYVDGEPIMYTVYEIDGIKYAFNGYGELVVDDVFYFYDSYTGDYHYIRADEYGKLITGWYYDYDSEVRFYYFEDTCYAAIDGIITIDGLNYYFDWEGRLLTNSSIMVDGVLYEADESGVLTAVVDSKDGWVYIDDETYYRVDGEFLIDALVEIDGYTYYFDYDGTMVFDRPFSCWNEEILEFARMYADEDGHVLFLDGWYQNEKLDWYYFKDTGILACDEILTIGGADYYFASAGWMLTGSFDYYNEEIDEWLTMKADENGAILYLKGWYQDEDENWYYFKEEGIIAAGEFQNIGGSKYYFYSDGQMATGAFEYYDKENEMYVNAFANPSGAIVEDTGWFESLGSWYYIEEGELVRDCLKTINGATYYFNYDGRMVTGRFSIYDADYDDGINYFAYESGAIHKNGWVTDGLYWYYAKADGRLYTSEWLNDQYYFMYNGVMAVGDCYIDYKNYQFDSNGSVIRELGSKPGWQKYNGSWYYFNEDLSPYDGWLNDTYYLSQGLMVIEEEIWIPGAGGTSFVRYDGTKVRGWYDSLHYGWIYADEDGNLLQNTWLESNGTWYYFDWMSMVHSSIMEIDGQYNIFDSNGVWKGYLTSGRNEWVQYNGGWYYYDENGELVMDCSAEIDGSTYYFDYDGRMYENTYLWWANVYVNSSGQAERISAGWHQDNDTWFYYESAGEPASGLTVVDGVTYYFYADGEMFKGIRDINGEYVLFNNSGAMQKLYRDGWYSVNQYGRTVWFYVEDGAPVEGVRMIDGKLYNFYEYDGEMIVGIHDEFLFDTDGALAKNKWVNVFGDWYYADANGRYVTGEHIINGKTYWFGPYGGEWIK